tara:strand:+ start:575 stop:1930 length:1356 start_codon:yes stop_codon:yes gene_type:complete
MKIIVIDDDPTGSQTVHDCLLLLKWDYQTIYRGLRSNTNLLFILANTRALSEKDTKKRLEEICISLKKVFEALCFASQDYIVISRGDSTLRGHNFLEPYIINKFLGPFDATFHIPAFIEGDRTTINGNHYVNNIPVHETIFAKDKVFGFDTSKIKDLLYEKSKQKISLNQIKNILLQDVEELEIRKNNRVYQFIKHLTNNVHVIIDSTDYSHLDKISLLFKQLLNKKRFLFRTAASFISSVSNIQINDKSNNYYSKLRRKNNKDEFMKGLVVVGSCVDLTTIQLNKVLEITSFKAIEIDVFSFYKLYKVKDNTYQVKSLKRNILNSIRLHMSNSFIPVLFTSRKFIFTKDINDLINFQNYLSRFIAEIVSEIKDEIGYLISKGGITSNTILSSGFQADSVYLEGQILTGISLVTLQMKNKKGKLPIVTFPGNLGKEISLIRAIEIIENKKF